MSTYPELHFPKELKILLEKENFDKPKHPKSPERPDEPSIGKILLGIIIIIAGISIGGSGFITIGVIVGIIFFIIFKSDMNDYENKKEQYQINFSRYYKELEIYDKAQKLKQIEYNKKTKKLLLEEVLNSSTKPTFALDYKKGASQDFLAEFLYHKFGNKIRENVTVLTDFQQKLRNKENNFYRNDYNDRNENKINNKTYRCDFAYYDAATNLFIDIEIDEPYSLLDKNPIHLDDQNRNTFFNDHGWIVLRFAEEQVIDHPELICDIIEKLVNGILINNNLLNENISDSNVDNFILNKWTIETVPSLIASRYREKCIKRIDTNSIKKLKLLDKNSNLNKSLVSPEYYNDAALTCDNKNESISYVTKIKNLKEENASPITVTTQVPKSSRQNSTILLIVFVSIIIIFFYSIFDNGKESYSEKTDTNYFLNTDTTKNYSTVDTIYNENKFATDLKLIENLTSTKISSVVRGQIDNNIYLSGISCVNSVSSIDESIFYVFRYINDSWSLEFSDNIKGQSCRIENLKIDNDYIYFESEYPGGTAGNGNLFFNAYNSKENRLYSLEYFWADYRYSAYGFENKNQITNKEVLNYLIEQASKSEFYYIPNKIPTSVELWTSLNKNLYNSFVDNLIVNEVKIEKEEIGYITKDYHTMVVNEEFDIYYLSKDRIYLHDKRVNQFSLLIYTGSIDGQLSKFAIEDGVLTFYYLDRGSVFGSTQAWPEFFVSVNLYSKEIKFITAI